MVTDFDLTDGDVQAVLTVVVELLIVIPIVLFHVTGPTGVEVFSVIVTGLLTLALVVLYFQQSTILDRQTRLMNRDYQSALMQKGPATADEDQVIVRLKNSGRGKVQRLFLKSEIVGDTAGLELVPGRNPMKISDNGSFEIPPESDFRDYSGKVLLRVQNHDEFDSDRGLPFSIISRMLSVRGIETIRLKLYLEVIDEGITDGEFKTIEIAEQDLSLKPPETREVDGEEEPFAQSTSVEEGIESRFASTQDINKVCWEEITGSGSDSSE